MDLQNLTTKQKIILLLVVAICGGAYLVYVNLQDLSDMGSEEKNLFPGNEAAQEQEEKSERKYYEITGQVNSPGVYEVEETQMMVIELIALAGGLTDTADLYTIHKDISLSALVEDRQKVYIPGTFERTGSASLSNTSISKSDTTQNSGKISINNASSQELESLPDIGPSTSAKIIAARPFASVEDLKKVQGIGDKTYNNIVSLISL